MLRYAQLVRLPALPTAIADIAMAALAMSALPGRWAAVGLLMLASACLYCSGMVWNDYFDVEQDRKERPSRPLVTGAISLSEALRLGVGLMVLGVVLAFLAGLLLGKPVQVTLVAVLLTGSILLYDAWLKQTILGPISMGACRFLNVLLGATAGDVIWPLGWHLALVVGLYIVGVTWFARSEAQVSQRKSLTAAAFVMLAALILALPIPVHREPGSASPLFPYLLVALAFIVGLPVVRAIENPNPGPVQTAVKRCLFSLILLDATLAAGTVGTIGLVLLILLLPSLYLGRRLYAT